MAGPLRGGNEMREQPIMEEPNVSKSPLGDRQDMQNDEVGEVANRWQIERTDCHPLAD